MIGTNDVLIPCRVHARNGFIHLPVHQFSINKPSNFFELEACKPTIAILKDYCERGMRGRWGSGG